MIMSRVPRPTGAGRRFIGARPTTGTGSLLAAQVAAFLAYQLLGRPTWVDQHLALVPERAIGLEPWQLLTSNFVHLGGGAQALVSIIFGAITLWIFGGAVESAAGRGGLLRVWFGSHLVGALAAAAIGRAGGLPIVACGMEFSSLGLIAAFGAAFGNAPVSFFGVAQMRGRTVAYVLLGLFAVQMLLARDVIGIVGGALAAGAGLLAMRWKSGWTKKIPLWRDQLRMWRLRRKYKVIQGGREPKRYMN